MMNSLMFLNTNLQKETGDIIQVTHEETTDV